MNYVGVKKGSLLVLDEKSNGSGKHKTLICKCNCGRTVQVKSHNFKKGKHCSCKKYLYNDLTNLKFGKITVLSLEKRNKEFNNKRGHLYKCECNDCKKIYFFHSTTLKRKGFKGCRCNNDPCLSSKRYWYRVYKSNAKKRNLIFDLSFEKFISLCQSPCYYTGLINTITINKNDLSGIWKCNGIDRVDNTKGYIEGNIVPCSKQINKMKGNLNHLEFLSLCTLVHKNN